MMPYFHDVALEQRIVAAHEKAFSVLFCITSKQNPHLSIPQAKHDRSIIGLRVIERVIGLRCEHIDTHGRIEIQRIACRKRSMRNTQAIQHSHFFLEQVGGVRLPVMQHTANRY